MVVVVVVVKAMTENEMRSMRMNEWMVMDE